MLEISDLKSKKLPELQEMAKALNVPKFRTLKKLDLVYQILDHQAADPTKVAKVASVLVEDTPKPAIPKETKEDTRPTPSANEEKPKRERKRVQPVKKAPVAAKTETKEITTPVVKNKTEAPNKENSNNRKPNPRQDKNDRNNNGHHKNKNQKNGNNRDNKGNRDIRNRYKEPDFEFDAIIESEGVLDIMQDGYGFLRSSDYNLSLIHI